MPKIKLQIRYLQAEDLALRAVQAEYDVNVSRHVTGGADSGFDGAFAVGGRFHVIEVKYSFHTIDKHSVRNALARVVASIKGYGWRNVQIIMVLVYEEGQPPNLTEVDFSRMAEDFDVPIVFRRYSFGELKRLLGVVEYGAG